MTVRSRRQHPARAALLGCVLAAGLAAAPAARPAEVSAEAAQAIEQQLHDWLAALLGPRATLGERPLRVTAEADHYRLEVPFAAPLAAVGLTVEGDPVSAVLTPLEGGRWALDDVRAPSPLRLSYPIASAGTAGGAGAGVFTATLDAQDQHAVIDPSLATPSRWDATIKGYTSSTEGGGESGTATLRIEESSVHVSVDPAADGRVNIVEETDSRLIASNATMPPLGLASFSIGRMRASVRLNGVAPERVAPIAHAVLALAPLCAAAVAAAQAGRGGGGSAAIDHKAVHDLAEANRKAAEADRQTAEADRQALADGRMTPAERKQRANDRHAAALARQQALQAARAHQPAPAPAATALTSEQHAAAHDALVALADLMSGFEEQQTLEDVHAVAGGFSGHFDKAATGFSLGAPDGRAQLRLSFALDGLDSADVPPGVFRDYLPRHIAIAPRIGGVPAADLRDLLLRAADSNGDDPMLEAQAKALLDKGPVVAGLDELSLDLGPATLKGSGELRIGAADHYEGEAHFVATGLDELIRQANTVPDLKQAAPVLFLLKGMGRQDGANTIWDITYRDNKVLVNGNDMSGMLPGK
jgi:hypothetical protein